MLPPVFDGFLPNSISRRAFSMEMRYSETGGTVAVGVPNSSYGKWIQNVRESHGFPLSWTRKLLEPQMTAEAIGVTVESKEQASKGPFHIEEVSEWTVVPVMNAWLRRNSEPFV